MPIDLTDIEPPRTAWRNDRGVMRRAPARHWVLQAQLREALARVHVDPPVPAPRVDAVGGWSDAEMLAASAAYARMRAGTGPELSQREQAALRAHWALKARVRKGRPGPRTDGRPVTEPTAVEQIMEMVDGGLSLEAIAEARGCARGTVIKRLQEVGLRDVVAELRAREAAVAHSGERGNGAPMCEGEC